MRISERIKDAVISKTAEGIALSASAIIIWSAVQIAPIILPAIDTGVQKSILISMLLASLALNIIFVVIFWAFNRRSELSLKYGIYWDNGKTHIAQIAKFLFLVTAIIKQGKATTANHARRSFHFATQAAKILTLSKQ